MLLRLLLAVLLAVLLALSAGRAGDLRAMAASIVLADAQTPAGPATVGPQRRVHILDGDRTGGGHRAGTGEPGKTLFPAGWSDNEIIAAIESVANDPRSRRVEQPNGRIRVEGTRRGVRLRVIVGADGHSIITGYPLQPRQRREN